MLDVHTSSFHPPHRPLSKTSIHFLSKHSLFTSMPSSQVVSIRRLISSGAYLPAGHNQVRPGSPAGEGKDRNSTPAFHCTGTHKKGSPYAPHAHGTESTEVI